MSEDTLKKIVCLGDSLTEGYNIDRKTRWTKLLSNHLNIVIINSGISGDTTAGMLARFQSDVVVHKPSHLIILGGTNDLYFDWPDNYIIGNIKTMLRQAQYHNIVTMVGLPPPIYPIQEPNTGLFISESKLIERLAVYRKKLMKFALDDKQPVIDFAQNMSRDLYLLDGVHPTTHGQPVLLKSVLEVLHKLEL